MYCTYDPLNSHADHRIHQCAREPVRARPPFYDDAPGRRGDENEEVSAVTAGVKLSPPLLATRYYCIRARQGQGGASSGRRGERDPAGRPGRS